MDDRVIAAMARWPNVPDVFGWLSLNTSGHWRLHSAGDAVAGVGEGKTVSEGVSISSQRINQFINRNYEHDAKGQWYFQNGPQRVYVRLDSAPFILHTVAPELDRPAFLTHNGQRTDTVMRWCLDDAGHLYADTELGAGLVAGRDLEQVMDKLTTEGGDSLLDMIESVPSDRAAPLDVRWRGGSTALFYVCSFEQVPDLLGFVRYPRPGS